MGLTVVVWFLGSSAGFLYLSEQAENSVADIIVMATTVNSLLDIFILIPLHLH